MRKPVVALLLSALAACEADKTDEFQAELASPDVAKRVTAANKLGKQRTASRPAIPALVAALDDGAWQVRVAATVALVRIGDKADPPRAIEPLSRLVNHENDWVRRYAVWALGMFGAKAGHAALLGALADPSPLVREFAAEAIGAAAGKATPEVLAVAKLRLEALAADSAKLASGKHDAAPVVARAIAAIDAALKGKQKE